jgi:hypothetical protein
VALADADHDASADAFKRALASCTNSISGFAAQDTVPLELVSPFSSASLLHDTRPARSTSQRTGYLGGCRTAAVASQVALPLTAFPPRVPTHLLRARGPLLAGLVEHPQHGATIASSLITLLVDALTNPDIAVAAPAMRRTIAANPRTAHLATHPDPDGPLGAARAHLAASWLTWLAEGASGRRLASFDDRGKAQKVPVLSDAAADAILLFLRANVARLAAVPRSAPHYVLCRQLFYALTEPQGTGATATGTLTVAAVERLRHFGFQSAGAGLESLAVASEDSCSVHRQGLIIELLPASDAAVSALTRLRALTAAYDGLPSADALGDAALTTLSSPDADTAMDGEDGGVWSNVDASWTPCALGMAGAAVERVSPSPQAVITRWEGWPFVALTRDDLQHLTTATSLQSLSAETTEASKLSDESDCDAAEVAVDHSEWSDAGRLFSW